MINVTSNLYAPNISDYIKKQIDGLNHPENYVLSLQLSYKDNNTIFYLKKVKSINFNQDYLEIEQENNNHAFFDYNYILEYCVINAEDVIDSIEGECVKC
jgi:hypothetical protein